MKLSVSSNFCVNFVCNKFGNPNSNSCGKSSLQKRHSPVSITNAVKVPLPGYILQKKVICPSTQFTCDNNIPHQIRYDASAA